MESKPKAMALVMLMVQLPVTRDGADQVSKVACTLLGSWASIEALSVVKAAEDMLSDPVGTVTRMTLAAGMPRAVM